MYTYNIPVMSTPDLPNVTLKNSLQSHVLEQSVISQIVLSMRQIPNLDLLRNDLEVLKRVCNLVENMVDNNQKSTVPLDKKQIAVKIMTQLFNLTPPEATQVSSGIDYLINNEQIVKIPFIEKALSFASKWLLKKLS